MAELVVGIGGTGVNIPADISDKGQSVSYVIVVDCSGSMANAIRNSVLERSRIADFGWYTQLHESYTDAIRNTCGRIQKNLNLSKDRSQVNDFFDSPNWMEQKMRLPELFLASQDFEPLNLRKTQKVAMREYSSYMEEYLARCERKTDFVLSKLREYMKQRLDISAKAWRNQLDMLYINLKSSGNSSDVAKQRKMIIESLMQMQDLEEIERDNFDRNLNRLINHWSEPLDRSILKRYIGQMMQLQKQRPETMCMRSLRWHNTMLYGNRGCGKTDMTKVRRCDCLRRLLSLNHKSKLFVFHPKLQIIDRDGYIPVMLAA